MIATTIEQSKKLIELGLNEKSADMVYQCIGFSIHSTKGYHDFKYRLRTKEDHEHSHAEEFDIFAWSLSALLKMLPFPTLCQEMYGGAIVWRCYITLIEDNTQHMSLIQENPINAAFDCLVWLLNSEIKV
jgi:hypothetical protein